MLAIVCVYRLQSALSISCKAYPPLMTSMGMRDSLPPIGKFMRLRWVCAPQYRVSSTMISPKASDSVLALDVAEDMRNPLDPEEAEELMVALFERGSNGSSEYRWGERRSTCWAT